MKSAHLKAGFVAFLSYLVLFVLIFYGIAILFASIFNAVKWRPNVTELAGPV